MYVKRYFIAFSLTACLLIAPGLFSGSAASQQPDTRPPAAMPSPTPPIEEEKEVVKVETESVNVLFTAQDKNRRLLLDLKPEQVRIFENGKLQEISSFSKQVDLPLSLAILIDTSLSQERTLPEEKAAAMSFLESVVRPKKDEVSIVSFTGESTLEQGMTNNMMHLRRAVDRVVFVPPSNYIGGGVVTNGGSVPGTPPISGDNQRTAASTALWDAIWVTSDEVLGRSPDKTRRAIILLSDGDDTYSRKKLDEAVQSALKAEAIIYSIGIGDNYQYRVNESALKKLSENTGGRAYFPRDEGELREAFKQIQVEMRSQYLVSYEPTDQTLDGSYRKIEIVLADPEMQKQKIKLTHRLGYFARTAGKK